MTKIESALYKFVYVWIGFAGRNSSLCTCRLPRIEVRH